MDINGPGTTEGAAHILRIQPLNNSKGMTGYIEIRSYNGNTNQPTTNDKRADVCRKCAIQAALFVARLEEIEHP